MSALSEPPAVSAAAPVQHHLTTLIAHIDHGKTSFSDALLPSLNPSHFGSARLLDSDPEERRRGITIKCSKAHVAWSPSPHKHSVSDLVLPPVSAASLTLLDSPGHHDFSGAVSSSIALTRQATLLVDVRQGVQPRTVGVVRQSVSSSGALGVLVMNKVDMGGGGWRKVVTDVNALCATLENADGAEAKEEGGRFDVTEDGVVFASAVKGVGMSFRDYLRLIFRANNRLFPGKKVAFRKLKEMAQDPERAVEMSEEGARAVRCGFGEGTFERFEEFLSLPNEYVTKDAIIGKLASTRLVPPGALERLGPERACKTGWDVYRRLFPLAKCYFRALASLPPPALKGPKRIDLQSARVVDASELRGCGIDGLGEGKKAVSLCRCFNEGVDSGEVVQYWKDGKGGECRAWFLDWRDNTFRALPRIEPGEVQAVYFDGVVNPDSMFEEVGASPKPQMPLSFTVRPADEGDRVRFNDAITTLSQLGTQVKVQGGDVVVRVGGEVEMENLIWELKNVHCDFGIVVGGERVVYRESVGSFEGERAGYGAGARKGRVNQEGVKAVWDDVEKAREGGWEVAGGSCKGAWEGVQAELSVYPRRELWDGVEDLEEYRARREEDEKALREVADLCANDDNENWLGLRKGATLEPHVLEAVKGGWREAMRIGPVLEEEAWGVVTVVEGVSSIREKGADESLPPPPVETGGYFTSQLAVCIRLASLTRPFRVVESHVKCSFQSSLSSLGPVYSTVAGRRGRVIKEDMLEGTDVISVVCSVPMKETKGMTGEILDRSSGNASAPTMEFLCWTKIDEDPFWVPSTEEERELYGEGLLSGDASTGLGSVARDIVRSVRRSKGLVVREDKLVDGADKQRNMSRKK